MDINHATELLRHAEKIGRPAGDTPAVMRAAAAHIEDLERELRAAEIRLHDVATLCANVESELAEIKRRTYVAVTCNHVGRMERAEARVAELEAERAERERQEPIATVGWDRNFMGIVWHGKDMPEKGVETLLYAAPPVTEQGCVTVTTDESGRAVAVTRQDDEHRILGVIWEAPVAAPVRLTDRDKDGLAVPYSGMGGIEDYRAYAQDVETAALRANGFKVEE